MSKQCATCGLDKPLDEFYRNRSRPDGRTEDCKPCRKALVLRKKRENKEAWTAYCLDYRRRNFLAHQARTALHRACKTGKLIRPTHCERCNSDEYRPQAHHHNGYDREHWYDVQWLCPQCHSDVEPRRPKLKRAPQVAEEAVVRDGLDRI